MAGFGIGALSVNTSCADNPMLTQNCDHIFNTNGVGGGLFGAGLGIAIGGAVLLALPPPRVWERTPIRGANDGIAAGGAHF